tara:strand:+ start:1852 stop:3324 length:1473 start_codon:yes stop_codon:yes gene_type:complete
MTQQKATDMPKTQTTTTQHPRIDHHGARTGVTGSCHQLHLDEHHSLLIDCGLFQGKEAGNRPGGDASQPIDFDISTVQALIATHVHIDHVGRIPWLLAAGYRGPILCSEPSAKLLPLVLEDAFQLGISRDQKLVNQYINMIEQRIVALPYGKWFCIKGTETRTPSPLCKTTGTVAKVRLQRAGHILGSAYVEIDHNNHRTVFSGDLGACHTPLLRAPRSPYRADTLVLESTYGDRNHENRATRKQRLQAAINKALQNQGTVLIPAFSIGRTQELLYELEELINGDGYQRCPSPGIDATEPNTPTNFNNLPIILDSPLAARITAAYRDLQPFWNNEAHARLQQGRKPLAFDNLLTVNSHAEHQKMVNHLAHSARPAIVIAGSGMCTAGRIVNYLKAMLGDVSQTEGTPGREIQRNGPQQGTVLLDGERYRIRAGVQSIGGYSAHADQQGLLRFVKGIKRRPRDIRLVHGEEGAKRALMGELGKLCNWTIVR